jgi:hypothetical protein
MAEIGLECRLCKTLSGRRIGTAGRLFSQATVLLQVIQRHLAYRVEALRRAETASSGILEAVIPLCAAATVGNPV